MRLSKTAKIMCGALLALLALFMAVGMAVIFVVFPFEEPAPFALGLGLGVLHSIAKVVMLEKSLERILSLESGARNLGALHALLRYFFTMAVLALAFLFPDIFGRWGTIIGVLSLQLAAYITGYILRKDSTEV